MYVTDKKNLELVLSSCLPVLESSATHCSRNKVNVTNFSHGWMTLVYPFAVIHTSAGYRYVKVVN